MYLLTFTYQNQIQFLNPKRKIKTLFQIPFPPRHFLNHSSYVLVFKTSWSQASWQYTSRWLARLLQGHQLRQTHLFSPGPRQRGTFQNRPVGFLKPIRAALPFPSKDIPGEGAGEVGKFGKVLQVILMRHELQSTV